MGKAESTSGNSVSATRGDPSRADLQQGVKKEKGCDIEELIEDQNQVNQLALGEGNAHKAPKMDTAVYPEAAISKRYRYIGK